MSKQKITMTIDEKVFNAFKELCKRRAMKVSSKVELMMREFVEESDDDIPAAPRARRTPSQKNSVQHESDDTRKDTTEQSARESAHSSPHTSVPKNADDRDEGDVR